MQRVRALPEPTQRLMLLAAADPTGDATLLWRAAPTLGWDMTRRLRPMRKSCCRSAPTCGSGTLRGSAAFSAGSREDRRAAHLALAAATDAQTDPDRRVWHLAAAATGPDEEVAAAPRAGGGRAEARAGLAAWRPSFNGRSL